MRNWLESYFDHTFLASEDDPHLSSFREWEQKGIIQLRVLPNVGMEATAQFVYDHLSKMIQKKTQGRVWITKVEVRENEFNSAIFIPEGFKESSQDETS